MLVHSLSKKKLIEPILICCVGYLEWHSGNAQEQSSHPQYTANVQGTFRACPKGDEGKALA